MTLQQKENEPQLQKLGAGLPFFEALISRYWPALRKTKKTSWDNRLKDLNEKKS